MMSMTALEHLSSSAYAEKRHELIQLANKLTSNGAQTVLDLPRIVVIGNQSAGKSSVVEAISGITVPRDAGTCTRAPMECRLSSSTQSWSCRVYIRWEYDEKGKKKSQVSENQFGEVITDKADVEIVLRRAQASVLNPHLPSSHFIGMNLEQLRMSSKPSQSTDTLPFSKNIVIVEIEGPGLTDLSFIDLPGIVSNAAVETVKLVEDLVVSHIQGNSLILVALPMSDDLENQRALRLAKEADPEGQRTIGVLTKPDLVGTGSNARDIYLEIIEGRRSPLRHGYFCTRQPDDDERAKHITLADARKAEKDFFESTRPWSGSTHKNRFGTGNLVQALSTQLEKVISSSLPKIGKDADALYAEVDRELAAMPKPLDREPLSMMLELISALGTDFSNYAQGSQSTEALVQDNRLTFKKFKYAIRSTAPNFKPFVSNKPLNNFVNQLDNDDIDDEVVPSATDASPLYLEDMQAIIEKSITRELPDHVPFRVTAAFIQKYQVDWFEAVRKCFDEVRLRTQSILVRCVKTHFARWSHLEYQMSTYVSEFVRLHFDKVMPVLLVLLQSEKTPFTQNTHYLQECKAKWLAKYKEARKESRSAKAPQAAPETPSAARAGFSSFTNTDPTPLLGTAKEPSSYSSKPSNSSGLNAFAKPFDAKKYSPGNNPGSSSSSSSSTFGTPSPDTSSAKTPSFAPQNHAFSAFVGSGPAPFGGTPSASTAPSTFNFGAPTPTPTPKETPERSSSGESPSPSLSKEVSNELLAMLAKHGFPGLSAEDLAKLNPPDMYEKELVVMAEVRAYFQVSYKRIIDIIPMTIDSHFLMQIMLELQSFLISKMALGGDDASARCKRYLAEDPAIVARREDLSARKDTLERVRVELYNFGI